MRAVAIIAALLIASPAAAQMNDASLPDQFESAFLRQLGELEQARIEASEAAQDGPWVLRSGHFVFGMPRLIDRRHDFTPDGFASPQSGISVIVREGFVVANFDRMKVPLWVAQRWTRFDLARMSQVPSQDRPWREDLEVPFYARGGASYRGSENDLDRGHMARHAMNRAWGIDVSNWGTKMTNSAPQHRQINRDMPPWGELEDAIRDVVRGDDAITHAVWTISGTIYRDLENPANETPEDDFQTVVRLDSGGFGVPDATYKVVAWFDRDGRFQARGYVFEQPHTVARVNGRQVFSYDLDNLQRPAVTLIRPIDEIEARTGVDFFPMLRDDIENLIERARPASMWGN